VVTNNPFWKGGRAFSKGIDQPLVNTMDPNREAFSSHCFTIFRLPGREAKVIDICVAEQRDSGDQELEFDEACMPLQDYLDQRDVGARQYDGNSPQGKCFFPGGDVGLYYPLHPTPVMGTNNSIAWFIPDIDIMGMAVV
jgi:hypothetical protein